jgi:hypothetical protein
VTAIWAIALCSLSLRGYSQQPAAKEDVPFSRTASRTITLVDFKGSSYLTAMQSAGNGIADKMAVDDTTPVTIASPDQIVQAIGLCDPAVGQKLYGSFSDGSVTFQSIVANIQGQSISPKQMRDVLKPFITNLAPKAKANIALDSTATLSLLASGSGTLVRIDGNNCFYNIGYESPVVQSGRSFGCAPGRSALDSSDYYYLKETGQYLSPTATADTSFFYRTLLSVLTNCDPSGVSSLTNAGQTVATDFLTVYTAELDRHVMVGLKPWVSPWEIDIAEVTLLANFSSASGVVFQYGAPVHADITAYGSRGSIGDSRSDFTALASQITSFEKQKGHHPDLVKAVTDLTPIETLQDPATLKLLKHDVFRRFLVYLNRPEFQGDVQSHPADLENAMLSLLIQVKADADQITPTLKAVPKPSD